MRTKQPTITIGDMVLVRRTVTNKSMSPWDPEPYRVTTIKGSMIVAERNGQNAKTITRNSSMFKKLGDTFTDITDEQKKSERGVETMPEATGIRQTIDDESDQLPPSLSQPEPLHKAPPAAQQVGRRTGSTKAAIDSAKQASAEAYEQRRQDDPSIRVQPSRANQGSF